MVPLSRGVPRPHGNNRASLPSEGDCHGNPAQRRGKCERKPQRYGAGILMATTLCGKKTNLCVRIPVGLYYLGRHFLLAVPHHTPETHNSLSIAKQETHFQHVFYLLVQGESK